MDAWGYGERVSEQRRATLAAPSSFESLIQMVKEDARDVQARAQPGYDRGLTDCLQPIFTFELPNTGDALFNGPWGYRAQYWISPGSGLAANAMLLAALTPTLLSAVDTAAQPDLAKMDLCASLSAASAKIWIRESTSVLIDAQADLDVERWVRAAENGIELARWGLVAPEATKYEVKGALLDPCGHEIVPSRKIRRHYDIHHYGYS